MELITTERIQDEVMPLTEKRKKEIYAVFTQLASEGKRVLAMAYRDFQKNKEEVSNKEGFPTLEQSESDLVFVGFTAMMDPPRPEVAPAIALCQTA